jgi:hypothetical protein
MWSTAARDMQSDKPRSISPGYGASVRAPTWITTSSTLLEVTKLVTGPGFRVDGGRFLGVAS